MHHAVYLVVYLCGYVGCFAAGLPQGDCEANQRRLCDQWSLLLLRRSRRHAAAAAVVFASCCCADVCMWIRSLV